MLTTFFINYFIFNYLYLLKKVNQQKIWDNVGDPARNCRMGSAAGNQTDNVGGSAAQNQTVNVGGSAAKQRNGGGFGGAVTVKQAGR